MAALKSLSLDLNFKLGNLRRMEAILLGKDGLKGVEGPGFITI